MRRNAYFPDLLRTVLAGLTLILALAATRPLLAHDSTHAAPLKSSGATKVVQEGETLSEIAQEYGTDTKTLRSINSLDSEDLIFYGLSLKLPDSGAGEDVAVPALSSAPNAAQFHTVQSGETLGEIALAYGTSVSQLVALNQMAPDQPLIAGLSIIVPAATASVAGTSPATVTAETVHVVQAGEHLGILAARYGSSELSIARANNLSDANMIVPGQRLVIATSAGATETAARSDTQSTIESVAEIGEALRPATSGIYHQHTDFPTKTEKWIDVDLSEQRVVAYEGATQVKSFIVSTGLAGTPTVQGEFRIWTKTPIQDMFGGSRAADNFYYLEDVQWVQYFFEDYAFHGTYWHDNFGQPMSRGCVNMRNEDAQWLYTWAGPSSVPNESGWVFSSGGDPGTLVVVHE